MLRKIDFIGVVVIIVKIYLFGLFVDFYRLERMFCNEMIFVLLKVIDVIVVFKLVKVIKMGDGSLNFVFLIQLNYVSNMSIVIGFRVFNVIVKVRIDNIVNMNVKLVIVMDFVIVFEYGNLDCMVDFIVIVNNIDIDEVKFIKLNFERYEEYRINDFGVNQVMRMIELYVFLIRFFCQFELGFLLFLGMVCYEVFVGLSNGNGFINFYGKLVIVNFFISNLGSVY